MAERKRLIIANWKMHFTTHEASLFVHKIEKKITAHPDVEIVLAPSFLALPSLSMQIDHHKFRLCAQDFYWRDEGSYTGEVSAHQLRGLVSYALVGHSERRHTFHETARDIRNKVQAALRNDIQPVLCVGETAHERTVGETNAVIHDQLTAGLANVTSEDIERIVIAYEPVWAIGTGESAPPYDIQLAVRAIRSQVKHLFGATAARSIRVLYGGSVTSDTAAEYLAVPGIDGLLVGGTSLVGEQFTSIVSKASPASKRS